MVTRATVSSQERLRRPAINQVEAALWRLASALQNAQAEYFSGVQRSSTHGSKAVLERDLADLSMHIRAFLNVDAFEPAGLLKRLFNIIGGHEKGLLGASVEDAREVIVTSKQTVVHGSVYGFRWHQIVRTLEATLLLISLDPRFYWKKIDGEAALALVDFRAGAAKAFPNLDIEWVRTHDPDAVGLVRRMSSRLKDALRETGEWMNGAATAKSVAELGEDYPYLLERIPDTETGPQYFARKAGISRLNALRRFWSDVVEDWVAKGIIPKSVKKRIRGKVETVTYEQQYFVRINAGALKMGGFHPPHESHHDGSMFDVWPTALGVLPIFVKAGLPQLSIDYDPDELKLDRTEPVDAISAPSALVLPQKRLQMKDWRFPTPEEYEKAYKQKAPRDALALWTKIATAFSQCIFLTFPSSTILASTIPLDALAALTARLEGRVKNSSEEEGEPYRMVLDRLKTVRPLTWLNDPEPKREKVRFGHRHHWHINYGASLLGKEGNIPSPRQGDADKVEEVISMLLDTLVFRDIMGLSLEPPQLPDDRDEDSE